MPDIILYTTEWCGDCRRTKKFLKDRHLSFREVNIEEDPNAEELVLRVNEGRMKVPTIEVNGRYLPAARLILISLLRNCKFR